MKTQITSFLALVSVILLLSSCQKDALVDNVVPEYNSELSTDLRSSDQSEFTMWQEVDILQPDCNDPIMINSEDLDTDELSKTSGCTGLYGLHGDLGQGWIGEYGRFKSEVDLKFDATSKKAYGTISLEFFGPSDILILKAMGDITRVLSDDGPTIKVNVSSMKGTGRFENAKFHGELTIMEADQIFDGRTKKYQATIMINGAFGK